MLQEIVMFILKLILDLFLFFLPYIILLFFIAFIIRQLEKRRSYVNVYIGCIGIGKSSLIASFIAKRAKKGKKVYCNRPVKGCTLINAREDLGTYKIVDADVHCDESGDDFNNREFKTLPKNFVHFLQYVRHYGCTLNFYSQAQDIDIKIIRLVQRKYILLRSAFFPYTIVRELHLPHLEHNELTGEDIIVFKKTFPIPFITRKYTFAPFAWHLFDSHEMRDLPEKEFPVIPFLPFKKHLKNSYLHKKLDKQIILRKDKFKYEKAYKISPK